MDRNKTVVVEEYNPEWPRWFDRLKSEIWPKVRENALAIEHVGSTSVPGLAAKPVIDLDLVVEDQERVLRVIEALKPLGYVHRGNLGIEGREAFRIRGHETPHHLYVCTKDALALRNHLALRDHLRESEEARSRYSLLKKDLASRFPNSIDDYVEGKTAFIVSILASSGLSEAELGTVVQVNRKP